ncbi:MAG: hypothetical protein V7644_21 [Actinomycetota bacterium]
MRSLSPAAAVAAAAVLTATGCAGTGSSGSSGLGAAASFAPANAAAFVAVDTSLSSGQWRAADGLLSRFPGRDALVTRLRQAFERRSKLSWADDVRPALGPELDLVALRGQPTQLVALTRPTDSGKLDALLAKAGGGIVSRHVGDWTAVSSSKRALDALAHVTAPLADAPAYREATAKLAGDALVRAYADGAQAQRLVAALPGQVVATAPPARSRVGGFGKHGRTFAAERYSWGAADLVAADDGLRLEAFTRAAPPTPAAVEHTRVLLTRSASYTPLLVDEIPAGPLLVADYQAASGGFSTADASALPAWLRPLLARSPGLAEDIDSVLGGETALYVQPGLPVPDVTLVTQPADTAAAVSALPQLLSELRTAFPLLGQLSLRHAVVGGQLVVSTSGRGIADFRSAGPRLSADPTFAEATKAAGLPQQTTGFVYANLKDALPLLRAAAPRSGLGDVGALRSLTAYGTRSGADSSYTLFLEAR